MDGKFPMISKYLFIMEDYLQEGLIKIPEGCNKDLEKKFKTANKLIEYFLEKYKEQIVFVDSKNSSIECHKCGFSAHENRANLKNYRCKNKFKCLYCTHEINSDLNAALVLVNRYGKQY